MSETIKHLSPRQMELALLIMTGKANKQIAFEMGLSTGTVKEYLFVLYPLLGVSNRTECAMLMWRYTHPDGPPLEYSI